MEWKLNKAAWKLKNKSAREEISSGCEPSAGTSHSGAGILLGAACSGSVPSFPVPLTTERGCLLPSRPSSLPPCTSKLEPSKREHVAGWEDPSVERFCCKLMKGLSAGCSPEPLQRCQEGSKEELFGKLQFLNCRGLRQFWCLPKASDLQGS